MSSSSWTPRNFDVVRRGYAPQQVDETFGALVRDLTTLRDQRDAMQRQVADLETRLAQATADAEHHQPTYRGTGDRIERILRLAEEEAEDLRSSASMEIQRDRSLAEQEVDRIRQQADDYASERRAQADAEAEAVLVGARREADAMREDADTIARSRNEEAENLFEQNRARAAQAAADFEITLSHRREQAERDFTTRMEAVEGQLLANERRSEALRLEAEEMRTTSERKAAQLLENARAQAEDLLRDATTRATRARAESERELASMVQRRDSINLQLTNVRQMLATLTGAPPPADPLAVEGEPELIELEDRHDAPADDALEDEPVEDAGEDEAGEDDAGEDEAGKDEAGKDEAGKDEAGEDAEPDATTVIPAQPGASRS